MILINGPNTPFGRMALVTALELGVTVENRVIAVATADWLDAMNPLRQIPTLLLDDGSVVFDSRVICAVLAALAKAPGLIPTERQVQTRWALTIGLMESGVSRQMERMRPDGERSPAAITRAEQRIAGSIARLEREADEICAGFGRIDRIAAAAALDYIVPLPARWASRRTAPRFLACHLAETPQHGGDPAVLERHRCLAYDRR